MELSFLAVVGIALAFLSAMVAMRMAAGGVRPQRIALFVGELWLAVIVWLGVFRAIGVAIGAPVGEGEVGELRNLGSRLASLSGPTRVWIGAAVAVSVALVAHLMWSLRRHMCGVIRPRGEE